MLRFQSAPGKDSKAIPDEQQRGGVFGDGENKGAESGQAGDANDSAGNLKNVSDLLGSLQQRWVINSFIAKIFLLETSHNRPSIMQSTLQLTSPASEAYNANVSEKTWHKSRVVI